MLRTLSIESLLSCAPRHKSSGFYPHAEAGGLIRRFLKLAVYVVYKRVIKKAEQDALAQKSSPKQDIGPT
ncbi:hypothetical protein OA92_19040 [Marinomonas sp. SBI22]|nr:hypothetical protein OA92_19040 [Marinomonas sp. SBI22]KZM41126.1 hypothetical protein OA91_18275 [Marinomonas sp. SBI8L]